MRRYERRRKKKKSLKKHFRGLWKPKLHTISNQKIDVRASWKDWPWPHTSHTHLLTLLHNLREYLLFRCPFDKIRLRPPAPTPSNLWMNGISYTVRTKKIILWKRNDVNYFIKSSLLAQPCNNTLISLGVWYHQKRKQVKKKSKIKKKQKFIHFSLFSRIMNRTFYLIALTVASIYVLGCTAAPAKHRRSNGLLPVAAGGQQQQLQRNIVDPNDVELVDPIETSSTVNSSRATSRNQLFDNIFKVCILLTGNVLLNPIPS